MTRRSLIRLLLAGLCAGRAAPVAAAVPPPRGFHLVDGWVLTDADLAVLRRQ
jgi:hypothetical protein